MLIGELADRSGASRRALRHYEDTLLLVPARDPNGYRVYSESDVARVKQIRAMIAAGLGTGTIRRYLDCARTRDDELWLEMCPELRAELDALALRLDSQQEALRDTKRRLCALSSGQ